jgi:hypothetical protein
MNPQQFYENAEISCPPDLSHRHIRLKRGNVWIKLFRVKDLNELRAYLIRFYPTQAYVSVSTYLEPELVGLKWKNKKAGYRYLPNIILSSDFVMDFDHGVSSLNQMLKAHKYLKTLGFEQFKAIRTKRGFHLWVLDWFAKVCLKTLPYKPFAREIFITEKKRDLCLELDNYGIEYDRQISMDTRRVVKLWGSLADDEFICKAYNDPQELAKEVIRQYLPLNNTETKRGLAGTLPNEINCMLGADKQRCP